MIKLKKLLKEDSVSPSFRQMINAIDNGLSIIFNPDEKYWPRIKNNAEISNWIGHLKAGNPEVIKQWPTIKNLITKIMKQMHDEKEKVIRKDKKMLDIMDKFGKKLNV